MLHPNGSDALYYDNNSYHTYVHSLTGTGEPRDLLRGIMVEVTQDGSRTLFSRNKTDTFDWDILMRDFEGGDEAEKSLVSTPGLDWWTQLSPDESCLMHSSDETGHYEVYVTIFPNAHTRWQVSTEGGEWPRWRSDGREIFYTTRDAIMVVEVSMEGGLTPGTPREPFKRPSIEWSTQWTDGFDVSADGRRFVLFRPVVEEDGEQPAIVILKNWFGESTGAATGVGAP